MSALRIMFVAGDPSGDVHASQVIKRLRTLSPDIDCYGVGGSAMTAAGFRQIMPFEPFACMGFTEVLRNLAFLLNAKRQLTASMRTQRPDAVVLVDYAGFNIPLLKAAHRLGIPTVWYIAPKVWAWKAKRAAVLGQNATAIACIFPFETALFNSYQALTRFVGNPLVEALELKGDGIRPDLLAPKPGTFYRIALVPGSRRQEVQTMLKPMVDAYMMLRRAHRQMRATVSKVPWLPRELYESAAAASGVEIHEGPLGDVLETCDVALVTSGTATLETALRGIPHVVTYRTSPITYRIFRALLSVRFVGLPNIVAGAQVVPECLQERASAPILAAEIDRFIESRDTYRNAVNRLLSLREQLGDKKPSEEVASMILDTVRADKGRFHP